MTNRWSRRERAGEKKEDAILMSPTVSPAPTSEIGRRLLSVLVVAADPVLRFGMSEFLRGHECVVRTARGIEQALEKIGEVTPDVLVLDDALAKAASELTVKRPIPRPTGVVVVGRRPRSRTLAGAYVLEKPIRPEGLLIAVDAASRHDSARMTP